MERVRFTTGEVVVVRVVTCAHAAVLVLATTLLATLFVRAGHDYTNAKAAAAITQADATDATCAKPAPTTLDGYSHLWDSLDPTRWAYGAAVADVPLEDGRIVWLYGDTATGRSQKVTSHNSAIVQRGGCLHVSHQGKALLPSAGAVSYQVLAALPAGNSRVLVTAAERELSPSCATCWTTIAIVAQIFTVNSTGDLDFLQTVELPGDDVSWGNALATDGQTVAIYGVQLDSSVVRKQIMVATVPVEQFTDRAAWTFARAPVARGVASDTFNAWHDATGWWVRTTGSADTPRTWRSNEPAGPYVLQAVPTPTRLPDLRFSTGRGLLDPSTTLLLIKGTGTP